MSRICSATWVWWLSFPRVSGDEPPGGAIRYKTVMFSPRERG